MLLKSIDDTIEKIIQYCDLLLLNQDTVSKEFLPILVEKIEQIFPQILNMYEKDLTEKKDEQIEWINQLNRVLGAFESKDDFYIIDVMINELIPNLEYFKGYID